MLHVAERIRRGECRTEDIDLLDAVARQIQNKCLCALGEFSTMAVVSAIQHFRSDFAAHTAGAR
jgi:NADH-quinone oxidoreductase subunit F